MSEDNKISTGKIIAGVTTGVAVTGATYLGISYYLFNKIFVKDKSALLAYNGVSDPDFEANKERNQKWLEESKSEDVYIESYDGLRLHALKVVNHPTSHKWLLRVHGYLSYATDVLDTAYEFDKNGYNCLLIDLRGHGLSDGDYIGMGWPDHYDLLDWINYLVELDKDSSICLFGVSMGASTVMNACGEFLPENVKCAIEDCGFSSIASEIKSCLKARLKVPGTNLFVRGIDLFVKKKCNFSLYEGNCRNQLQQSTTPMLFIHGEEDVFVPYENVFDNYYACNADKELFTVENAGHAVSFLNKNYYDRLFKFVSRYI